MRAGNHGLYGPTRRDAAISGGLSANPKLPHDREESKFLDSWRADTGLQHFAVRHRTYTIEATV